MAKSKLIQACNSEEWIHALELCGDYDTYALPQYHIISKEMGEGEPYLFFFEYNNQFAALPFLLCPINKLHGLQNYRYTDGTSVYGYPGLLSSINNTASGADEFKFHFQSCLIENLMNLNCIALFIRSNPLIDNSWLFEGIGEVAFVGNTVAVDLKKPESEQLEGSRKTNRYDIRKARKNGVIAKDDVNFESIDSFIDIYNETMERNNAANYYYFSKDYFLRFKELMGDFLKLFIAKKDGIVISGSLFLVSKNIIQYHLSGTPNQYLKLSGAKVILDEVRNWALKRKHFWLHLGGGLGGKEDSLFLFKAGFSKLRLSFNAIKLVIQPNIYEEIAKKREFCDKALGYKDLVEDYFPKYRRPIEK
jgi:hypothetical protein